MVNLLLEIGRGKLTDQKVEYFLKNQLEPSKRVKPAPLNDKGTLILWDVVFPFSFEIDNYSYSKMQNLIQSLFQFHSLKLVTMKSFKDFLEQNKKGV